MYLFILLFSLDAFASKYSDYRLKYVPKEKKCNKIEYFKKCSEISHYRGKDYIVFHWHDNATLCEFDNPKNPQCTWIGEYERIMIREGCEISWCKPRSTK